MADPTADPFPPDPDRYRLLVQQTEAAALFLIDTGGTIRTWNRGAERVFGWLEHEIVGQSNDVIWTPEDRAAGADRNEIETAALAGEAPDVRWHLRKDGTRVFVDGVMTSIRDDEGTLLAFAKVARDTTPGPADVLRQDEVRALRNALDAERAEVRRLTDALSEAVVGEQRRLAAVLHDDLQQLLVAASMHARILRSEPSPEETTEQARLVSDILSRALDTTRTLTSRLVPPDVLTVPLPHTLNWLAEHYAQTHALRVSLDTDAVDTPESPVEGHARLVVFQTARELLFNVVKHAHTDAARLSLRTTSRILTLVVADRGAGLADDAVTPDAAPGAPMPGGAGEGYGLTDLRRRLADIGGTLTLRPAPGRGTRAVVRLPLHTPGND